MNLIRLKTSDGFFYILILQICVILKNNIYVGFLFYKDVAFFDKKTAPKTF
jgi:hypothetical protein